MRRILDKRGNIVEAMKPARWDVVVGILATVALFTVPNMISRVVEAQISAQVAQEETAQRQLELMIAETREQGKIALSAIVPDGNSWDLYETYGNLSLAHTSGLLPSIEGVEDVGFEDYCRDAPQGAIRRSC